ncbi:MAG: hypothetical protein WKG01_18800 [Kofleriaceae bacterium]
MTKLIAASVVAMLGHVGTASAGVPGWCKDASSETSYNLKDLSSTEVLKVISTLALATCKPTPEARAAAAQIEASRQAWGKKLAMIDADWADAVAYAQASTSGRGVPPAPVLSLKDYATATPLDQYAAIASKVRIDAGGDVEFQDTDYAADMFEPNLSEVGRFAFVEACVDYKPYALAAPARFAQCQGDLDGFDRTKFATQLRGDTAHPEARAYKMYLRWQVYTLPQRMAKHAEEVKKIVTKDPDYKKWWTAAAAGRAQFAATVGTNKALMALATKMDGAFIVQSRKLMEGCEAATEAALQKAVAEKVPASAFKDAPRDMPREKYDYMGPSDRKDPPNFGDFAGPVLADIPELMFALGPYLECHKSGDVLGTYVKGLFKLTPGYRGPRRAALAAVMREKIELDDLNDKVTYPYGAQPFDIGNAFGTQGGVVASLKEEGEYVTVSFEKKSGKEKACVQSHYTKRVLRVNSDGSLSYELLCDKWGMVEYDDTPADMRVSKLFKPLLRKGVQFSRFGDVVVAVWPSKSAKVPSHILGVQVK